MFAFNDGSSNMSPSKRRLHGTRMDSRTVLEKCAAMQVIDVHIPTMARLGQQWLELIFRSAFWRGSQIPESS